MRCGIPPWLGICNSILPQLFQTNPYVQLIIQARVEIGNWSRTCCSLRCFQTQMCKWKLQLKCNNSKWTTMLFLKDDLQDMKQPTPCNFGIQNCLFCRRCIDGISQAAIQPGCQDLLHQPFSGYFDVEIATPELGNSWPDKKQKPGGFSKKKTCIHFLSFLGGQNKNNQKHTSHLTGFDCWKPWVDISRKIYMEAERNGLEDGFPFQTGDF